MIATGTLITMGVQICVSLINQFCNKENLEEIKKLQQKAKADAQKRSLERDYQKFQRSCEYQYKIEEESHKEKLKTIEQEFLSSFDKMAHNANLSSHYPLNISPYIINRSVIPISGTDLSHSRQEVFCILTNSNDKIFNKEVVPYIDKFLCNLIASYWNKDSLHTMCFFSNTWNERLSYCDEDIDNIKSTIATPTIAVTPYFERGEDGEYTIVAKLNMWGIGSEVSCQLPTGVRFSSIPVKYSTEQIDELIHKLIPPMICATAQAIDVYYWESYHLPPLLPSLILNKSIILDGSTRSSFKDAYLGLYNTLVLGEVTDAIGNLPGKSLVGDVALINQCNLPENNIKFLNDLSLLLDSSDEAEPIIRNSFVHLYESRTGEKFDSISTLRVELLQKYDVDLIRSMIAIAKKNAALPISKDLISVVRNKIQYWS
jgi:hypothetical protein